MSAPPDRPGTELSLRAPVDVADPTRPPRGRVARLAALVDVPVAVLHPRDDRAARLTRFARAVVLGAGPVDVVQLTDPRAVDVGTDLAAAARFLGAPRVHRDLTPGVEGNGPAHHGPSPELVSLRRRRIDGVALGVLRGARTAVVVAETRGTSRALLRDAVDLLDGMGVAVVGLVVHRGRLPRR